MNKTHTLLKLGAALGMALSLSACGGNVSSILKDAKLELKQENGQGVVSLTTEIDTKNLILSAVTLPIYDQQNPPRELGKVQIATDITTNKTVLTATFNYQTALNLPAPMYSSILPNGASIPLAGIDMSKMMVFDVGLSGSKLYMYYDAAAKKSVIGVAINIPSLTIGQTANLFANFNFNSVSGLAGIYLGQAAGTSGIGIFTDLSKVVFPAGVAPAFMAKASDIDFIPMSLTFEQQSRLDLKLWQMSVTGEPLVAQ